MPKTPCRVRIITSSKLNPGKTTIVSSSADGVVVVGVGVVEVEVVVVEVVSGSGSGEVISPEPSSVVVS